MPAHHLPAAAIPLLAVRDSFALLAFLEGNLQQIDIVQFLVGCLLGRTLLLCLILDTCPFAEIGQPGVGRTQSALLLGILVHGQHQRLDVTGILQFQAILAVPSQVHPDGYDAKANGHDDHPYLRLSTHESQQHDSE